MKDANRGEEKAMRKENLAIAKDSSSSGWRVGSKYMVPCDGNVRSVIDQGWSIDTSDRGDRTEDLWLHV